MSFVKDNLPYTVEALKVGNNFSYCAETAFLTREFLMPAFLENNPDAFLEILSTGKLSRMMLNGVFKDKNITRLVEHNNALRTWIIGLNFGDSLFDLDDEMMLSLIGNKERFSEAARAMIPNRLWFPFKEETIASNQFRKTILEVKDFLYMDEFQFIEDYVNDEPLKLQHFNKDQKSLYIKMCVDVIPSHLKRWLLKAEGLDSGFLHSISDLNYLNDMIKTCLYSESTNDNAKEAAFIYSKEKFGTAHSRRIIHKRFKSEAEYLNYANTLDNINIDLLMEGANQFNKLLLPKNLNSPEQWALRILERIGDPKIYLSETNPVRTNTYLMGLNIKDIKSSEIHHAFMEDISELFPELLSGFNSFDNLPLSRVLDVIKMELELTSST